MTLQNWGSTRTIGVQFVLSEGLLIGRSLASGQGPSGRSMLAVGIAFTGISIATYIGEGPGHVAALLGWLVVLGMAFETLTQGAPQLPALISRIGAGTTPLYPTVDPKA